MKKELLIKHEFVVRRAQGFSYEHISKKLNIAKATLIDWNKELRFEILSYNAFVLETLHETFKLAHEEEIAYFEEKLNRVVKEKEKQNLSELSLKKLSDYELKLHDLLKDRRSQFESLQKTQ